jgi:hypothetical protein
LFKNLSPPPGPAKDSTIAPTRPSLPSQQDQQAKLLGMLKGLGSPPPPPLSGQTPTSVTPINGLQTPAGGEAQKQNVLDMFKLG